MKKSVVAHEIEVIEGWGQAGVRSLTAMLLKYFKHAVKEKWLLNNLVIKESKESIYNNRDAYVISY